MFRIFQKASKKLLYTQPATHFLTMISWQTQFCPRKTLRRTIFTDVRKFLEVTIDLITGCSGNNVTRKKNTVQLCPIVSWGHRTTESLSVFYKKGLRKLSRCFMTNFTLFELLLLYELRGYYQVPIKRIRKITPRYTTCVVMNESF